MKNSPNSKISLSILLCAVTLLWLNLTGFAQPSTNQVLSLNGTSANVSIPSAASLQNSNAITVEAWIYPKLPVNGINGQFIVKGDDQINYSARSYEMDWFTDSPDTPIGEGVEVSLFLNTTTWAVLGASLPETNWVHVAATYSSASGLFQLYTNGVLSSSTTNDASGKVPLAGQFLRQTTLPLKLGGETIPEGAPFAAGYMDEVRIWKTNRSGDQIAETRFCHLTGTESNLTAYWNFDETNAIDLTGNGNNGTLEGGAAIVPIVGNDAVHAGVCGETRVIPNPTLSIAPFSFLTFSNLTLGGVYQLQQLAEGYYWANLPVNFTAANSVFTQMVSGVVNSGEYRLALSPVPAQAFAVLEVTNGFVIGAIVTSGGSGYVSNPPVSIIGYGSNAGGVSQIFGGVVTNIAITNAGIGYTNTTIIEIGPPPAAAVSPTVQLVIQINSSNLALYENYQIQFTPTLGTTWGNWNGGLFTSTEVTNSQNLFVTNATGFFRLEYVP